MYTDFLTTTAVAIVPTNVISLSTFEECKWLDHHIFKDTSLPPLSTPQNIDYSGYNFVYPLSVIGGTFNGNTYTNIISGGPFYDYCYQDYCYEQFTLQPINIFCVANVWFVLSAFDESQSKLVSVIYNFSDGSPLVRNTYNYTSVQPASLKTDIVKHTFLPTEKFVTTYTPSITALYEDGCFVIINFILNSFKCGIFNTFKDIALIDSVQHDVTRKVLISLEDKNRLQVFTNLLDLDAVVETIILPVTSRQIDTAENNVLTIIRASSARTLILNPVVVEPLIYEYAQGPGLDLIPDILLLQEYDIITPLTAINISDNIGAPYNVGAGLIVTPGLLRVFGD